MEVGRWRHERRGAGSYSPLSLPRITSFTPGVKEDSSFLPFCRACLPPALRLPYILSTTLFLLCIRWTIWTFKSARRRQRFGMRTLVCVRAGFACHVSTRPRTRTRHGTENTDGKRLRTLPISGRCAPGGWQPRLRQPTPATSICIATPSDASRVTHTIAFITTSDRLGFILVQHSLSSSRHLGIVAIGMLRGQVALVHPLPCFQEATTCPTHKLHYTLPPLPTSPPCTLLPCYKPWCWCNCPFLNSCASACWRILLE